jgi:hypothetical protein
VCVNYCEGKGKIHESRKLERHKIYPMNLPKSVLSVCPAKCIARLIALEGEEAGLST